MSEQEPEPVEYQEQDHHPRPVRAFRRPQLALLVVLLLAAWFRFVGLDWDEGAHLHPDERFLTQVEAAIEPTFSIKEYFSTTTSQLNPRNRGHNFFVYGSFPIFIVRYAAEGLERICPACEIAFTGYDGVHLVGRALSGLFDLATLVALFAIGRRLYDQRVGLLAAALWSMAVLPIQLAHFFAVDSFLTFFVALAFYFAIRIAGGGGRAYWLMFGVALGMAVATKISVWPMGLVLAAAVLVRTRRTQAYVLGRPLLGLAAAAVIAFLTFRVCQPYAFAGLDFDPRVNPAISESVFRAPLWWRTARDLLPEPVRVLVLPSPRWLANMDYIQHLMGGEGVETPPNHQWTDRKPILFPLTNIVLYGLGPALGVAAWLGWAIAILQILDWRRRPSAWKQHLLPVVWVTIFFLYQGTQWVKTMRYFIPLYPQLILLASWLLIQLGGRVKSTLTGEYRTGRFSLAWIAKWSWRQWASAGLTLVVLLLTFLWAFSFTKIYRQTMTRVAASRWIFQNVPTGATLLYDTADGSAEVQIPIIRHVYSQDGFQLRSYFEMPEAGTVSGVRMNYLSDPNLDPDKEVFWVGLAAANGADILTSTFRELDLQLASSIRGDAFQFDLPRTSLAAGEQYVLVTQVVAGAPVRTTGALLVNETSWDDSMPWRMDGLDGFSMYEGELLELYWEDNAEKRQRINELLDKGEYLIISSTRQLGSTTRIHPRYPLTIAYYEALFDGRLGYEPIQVFTADIHLGPLLINDVFAKLGWGEPPQVGWPPPGDLAAEEAFSVYDHPPVWIFKKRPDYTPSVVRAVLDSFDLSEERFVLPYDYTLELRAERRPEWLSALLPTGDRPQAAEKTPELAPLDQMWLDEETFAEQRAGGAWRDMFNAKGILSTQPVLGAAVWWLALMLLGWLCFPLAFVALNGLPSKGYIVSRILSLLIIAWLAWLAGSLNLLPYSKLSIWLAIGVLALVNLALACWKRRELLDFVRNRKSLILTAELVAVLLFIISLLIRSGNPDLWHPTFGGEKPLDLTLLNAVLRSSSFPPFDPWLAGAYSNYYYFGYVLLASLIKILGIVPYVAYNIALPMLFSLTGIGAFSIAYNLVEGVRQRQRASGEEVVVWPKKAIMAGLVAAVFIVLLGNLGQIGVLMKGWERLGGNEGTLLSQIGRGLVSNLKGERLPLYTSSWYWDATRIIPPAEGEAGPISEFPFFTFLYADLHAHMIDMPLVLLSLVWALGLAQAADRRSENRGKPVSRAGQIGSLALVWGVGALAIGALRATNTWDWPAMLGVGLVAVVYSAWRCWRHSYRWRLMAGFGVALLLGLSSLFFLPYTQRFVPAFTQVLRWEGGITPIRAYFAVNGLFLFGLVTVLGREFKDWTQSLNIEFLESLEPWALIMGLLVLLFLAVMVLLLALGIWVGPIVMLLMIPAGLLALQPRLFAERRAVLMLLTLGLALTLAVELVVFAGDISRMNTVFKFYNQVWLIFASISGAALVWAWDSVRRWRPAPRQAWIGFLMLLVFLAALYPPTAARAKINDRFHADQPPAGLNGIEYMRTATYHDRDQAMQLEYDYQIIRWLLENVDGSPVIMEANTFPKIYGWGSRISVNTGLPTVVGWEWHTRQHRAGFEGATQEVRRRAGEVIEFYNTISVDRAMQILHDYEVEYIVVGPLEQAYYDARGLAKFDRMANEGLLAKVYSDGDAAIYRVPR